MNKALTFFAGLLVGGAAGAGATYYILHDKLVADAQDEIERYAEHCEERIASIRAKYAGEQPDTAPVEEEDEVDPDDRDEALIRRNEGVKKYHHQDEYIGNYGANQVFEEKKVTELEKNLKEMDVNGVKDDPLIEEIDEDTYNEESDQYSKEVIDFVYPDEKAYWGYGTDNEMTVDQKFGMNIFELIGQTSRWLMDYVNEEEGYGEVYIRNGRLMKDFYVVIHNNES